LVFINDLEVGTTSRTLKFADDTKLFRTVTDQTDHLLLQNDLDIVCERADRWQMKFNVSKCKTMQFGRKTSAIEPRYYMYGEPLEEVSSEKDLGVVFSSDMKLALHCRDSYSKANRMLGLISRTIRYRNPDILLNLYKSLVRPHLDYCSSVWNPHYSKDINLLERVQHCFTCLFSELRSLPYEERLCQLGLWSLEKRCNRTDLIELFRLAKGISGTAFNEFFYISENIGTRGHSWKLAKNHCHCDARLQFFSQRVVNRWNSLSQEDVDAPSMNAFKGRLERRRRHQMDFFKDI